MVEIVNPELPGRHPGCDLDPIDGWGHMHRINA